MSKKKNSKLIVLAIILVVAIVAVALAVRVGNSETRSLNVFAYKIGGLDENGKFVKDTASIVTKDFYSVDGMEIKLAKNADVTYKVYYFDNAKTLISAEDWDADYSGQAPEGATQFKVVIIPIQDDEVTAFEIAKYAQDLKVSYAK